MLHCHSATVLTSSFLKCVGLGVFRVYQQTRTFCTSPARRIERECIGMKSLQHCFEYEPWTVTFHVFREFLVCRLEGGGDFWNTEAHPVLLSRISGNICAMTWSCCTPWTAFLRHLRNFPCWSRHGALQAAVTLYTNLFPFCIPVQVLHALSCC